MISRSMSVADSDNFPSAARRSTLDRMGIVFRRSTTLWTWASDGRSLARSMMNFMTDGNTVQGRYLYARVAR